MPRHVQSLFPDQDRTCAGCSGKHGLNHWANRKVMGADFYQLTENLNQMKFTNCSLYRPI